MRESDNPILADMAIVSGTPCFRGTRVPVRALTDYLAGGDNLDTFLDHFPSVERHQALATIRLACRLLEQQAEQVERPEDFASCAAAKSLLRANLDAGPFRPFRVVLADGSSHEITAPGDVVVRGCAARRGDSDWWNPVYLFNLHNVLRVEVSEPAAESVRDGRPS